MVDTCFKNFGWIAGTRSALDQRLAYVAVRQPLSKQVPLRFVSLVMKGEA